MYTYRTIYYYNTIYIQSGWHFLFFCVVYSRPPCGYISAVWRNAKVKRVTPPSVTACVYISIKRPLAALKSLVLSALLCKSSIQGSSTSFIHSFIYIKRKMSEASDWKDGTSIDMYSSVNGRVCVFFSISSSTSTTTTTTAMLLFVFLILVGCLFPFRWARSSFPLLWFSYFLFI